MRPSWAALKNVTCRTRRQASASELSRRSAAVSTAKLLHAPWRFVKVRRQLAQGARGRALADRTDHGSHTNTHDTGCRVFARRRARDAQGRAQPLGLHLVDVALGQRAFPSRSALELD